MDCRGQGGLSQDIGGVKGTTYQGHIIRGLDEFVQDAYQDLLYYFRWFDPLHEKESDIFYKLGYIDVKNLANRIKGGIIFQ